MKKISFIVAFMLLCTFALPAAAADNMSEVLLSVKERIDIPPQCTKFDSAQTVNGAGEKTTYSFTWSTPTETEEYESVNVGVTDTGIIVSVYFDTGKVHTGARPYYYVNKIIPKIEKSSAINTAQAFLEKTNPKQSAEFDFSGAEAEIYGDTYYVSTSRKANGIDAANSVTVQIDTQSGVVKDFSMFYTENAVFPALDNVLTQEQAQEKFSNGGMKKIYRDFGNGEMAKIVWQQTDLDRIYAVGGEKYDRQEELAREEALKSTAAGVATDSNSMAFSPEEQLELDSVAGLLTSEQAQEKLCAMSELGLDGMECENTRLCKTSDGYYMSLEFNTEKSYAYARIKAENGLLLDFYSYAENQDKSKPDDAFIQKYYADYVGMAVKSDDRYVRVQDGIEFPQNYISCSVNEKSGRVTNFSLEFDNNIEFEDTQGQLEESDIYKALFAKVQPRLSYIFADGNKTAVPVYTLNCTEFEYIDAKNARVLTYGGEEALQPISQRDIAYSDISGHFCEQAAAALASLDIGFEGGVLEPDKIITQKEYAALLAQCVYDVFVLNGATLDMAKTADCVIERGIIGKENYYPDEPLTRELAAKYLISSGAGSLSDAAQLSGIFKTDFADEADIQPELVGYVAIAKALGIVSGTDGLFYPKASITRAQAIVMLYNYLK